MSTQSRGDVAIQSMTLDDVVRFLRKVDRTGDCWEWRASRLRRGYGQFGLGTTRARQVMVKAHRVAFFVANDRLPRGVIRHRCDNPGCVRPEHLDEGSHADNIMDRTVRGRTIRGIAHAKSVLDDVRVREIRAKYAAGAKLRDLAAEYGVSFSNIHSVCIRRTWRHIA